VVTRTGQNTCREGAKATRRIRDENNVLYGSLNGLQYAQKFCWATRSVDGLIVEVRDYLDSVLVKQVINENELVMTS
jgi:ketosteroid isomerase-like protein